MVESSRSYLPAAGREWRLPLYDPFVKLLGGDAARKVLLDEAALRPGQRVLDVGCGTGTLATLIKQLHPEVDAVGLDPDPKALARARLPIRCLFLSLHTGSTSDLAIMYSSRAVATRAGAGNHA